MLDQAGQAEYVYYSNLLDRVALTLDQTREILQNEALHRERDELIRAPNGKEYEPGVVLSHREALQFVVKLAQSTSFFGESTVQEIHRRLMDGVLLSAGEYRECIFRTKGIAPFPPQEVPAAVDRLVGLMNNAIQQGLNLADVAWQMHHEMFRIHPFIEGNGRMARLILNLMRIKGGQGILVIKPPDHQKYLAAILRYQQIWRQQHASDSQILA